MAEIFLFSIIRSIISRKGGRKKKVKRKEIAFSI